MFQKLRVAAFKQKAASLAVVLVLIGGLAVSARAWSSGIRVDITNQSSYAIQKLFLSSSEDDWGRNLLGSSVLAPGGSIAVTAFPGRHDLKLVDEDGETCTLMELDINSDTAWSIADRWLLACESQ
jgi:hypothetical protein